jgi:proline iminopeptidase
MWFARWLSRPRPTGRSRWGAALLATLVPLAASNVEAQDRSFVSGGQALHYRVTGAGSPVVMLSGGPGFDVDYMFPAGDAFPNNRRVFLEQRGTGRSRPPKPRPEDMTLATAVADVEALRADLGQERLFLAGHSWGGMLAMAYAAAHPDRIDRLILIDSGGPTLEFAQWFDDNIRARMRPEDIEAQRYWTEAGKRGTPADKVAIETIRAITPAYFFDRQKGLAFANELTDTALHADVNELLFADLAKNYDVRAALRSLDRPVLIVQGRQDPIGDKTAEDLHGLIKGSTLVYLDRCGHFPWLEQPDAFSRTIRAFVDASR